METESLIEPPFDGKTTVVMTVIIACQIIPQSESDVRPPILMPVVSAAFTVRRETEQELCSPHDMERASKFPSLRTTAKTWHFSFIKAHVSRIRSQAGERMTGRCDARRHHDRQARRS